MMKGSCILCWMLASNLVCIRWLFGSSLQSLGWSGGIVFRISGIPLSSWFWTACFWHQEQYHFLLPRNVSQQRDTTTAGASLQHTQPVEWRAIGRAGYEDSSFTSHLHQCWPRKPWPLSCSNCWVFVLFLGLHPENWGKGILLIDYFFTEVIYRLKLGLWNRLKKGLKKIKSLLSDDLWLHMCR